MQAVTGTPSLSRGNRWLEQQKLCRFQYPKGVGKRVKSQPKADRPLDEAIPSAATFDRGVIRTLSRPRFNRGRLKEGHRQIVVPASWREQNLAYSPPEHQKTHLLGEFFDLQIAASKLACELLTPSAGRRSLFVEWLCLAPHITLHFRGLHPRVEVECVRDCGKLY